MFRYLAVGGRFDDTGGKNSGYMRKLFDHMVAINPIGFTINGGDFSELERVAETCDEQVIFWMPDVPNDKKKLVHMLKKNNKTSILITAKNNIEGKYSFHFMVARALSVKANLFVEFTKNKDGKYLATVADPLGNCFCRSDNIGEVASTLMWRVDELFRYTRIGSFPTSLPMSSLPRSADGSCWTIPRCPKGAVQKDFFSMASKYAEVFHELIHAENKDRLLGNLSFRCESGFPSFMDKDGIIFISQRNIDKREINADKFVAAKLENNQVLYWEETPDVRPSVDSPVQLMLYRYYPEIRFMLHSHTYIGEYNQIGIPIISENIPMTSRIIPCGAVEEFYEIIRMVPDRSQEEISINLRGHGSLKMGSSVEYFRNIPYVARIVPEFHRGYR